jgi:hypothetical protein
MSALYDYVLARPEGSAWGPSIWNFYETLEAAVEEAPAINAKEGGGYIAISYLEYKKLEKEFWLKDGPRRITSDKFEDMLNVLPPMRWKQEGALNSFMMSERMSGTFTYQYGQLGIPGGKPEPAYFQKMVDLTDPSTYMTETSLRAELAAGRLQEVADAA